MFLNVFTNLHHLILKKVGNLLLSSLFKRRVCGVQCAGACDNQTRQQLFRSLDILAKRSTMLPSAAPVQGEEETGGGAGVHLLLRGGGGRAPESRRCRLPREAAPLASSAASRASAASTGTSRRSTSPPRSLAPTLKLSCAAGRPRGALVAPPRPARRRRLQPARLLRRHGRGAGLPRRPRHQGEI